MNRRLLLAIAAEAARGPAPITSSDSDVTAWIAAVGQANTTQAEVNALTTFVVGAKAAGIWTMDRVFIGGALGKQAPGKVDLVTRSSLVEIGPPTWAANTGYTGDGVAKYVNLGWIPSNGPNAAQNSICLGAYVQAMDTRTANVYTQAGVTSPANHNLALSKQTGSTQMNWGANHSSGVLTTVSPLAGRWHAERTGVNAQALYYNGSSVGTDASASVTLETLAVFGLANNNVGSPILFSQSTIGSWWMGAGLGAANEAIWDGLIHTLFTTLSPANYS